MAVVPAPARTVYKASRGRKVALTFFVLLILPFLTALPFVIGMRVTRGLFLDSLPLVLVGVILAACFAFLLSHILYSYRTRIELGEAALKLNVPAWKGPTPGLSYIRREVPYAEIDRIEMRGEVYKELAVPSMMRAVTLVLKGGERIHLGYSHETSEDPAIPVTDIAARIAERAKIVMREKESIRVGSQYKAMIRGTPSWDDAADETERHRRVAEDDYRKLVQSNHKLMFHLAFVVLGLALIALVVDLGRNGYLN
jgi:hypothetical protein